MIMLTTPAKHRTPPTGAERQAARPLCAGGEGGAGAHERGAERAGAAETVRIEHGLVYWRFNVSTVKSYSDPSA